MELHRRRLAALETFASTSTSTTLLRIRDAEISTSTSTIRATAAPAIEAVSAATTMAATAATAATEAGGNPAIAPFDTGLAGVNQPQNMLFKDMLWWSLGIVALVILTIRIVELVWSKLRQVSAMSVPGDRQGYWKLAQWNKTPALKKHIIYAPLWRKRHNREIRLSSAINVGTLPSRLQTILLALYLISNFVYMFTLGWGNPSRWSTLAELRGRSGTLAAVNMVPLIILAGRNNPLIPLLRISFDTYNLLHRWMGRMVVVEAVIHTVAWSIVQVADGGWPSVSLKMVHDRFIGSGTAGVLALVLLLLLSLSPVRHAFYETFLTTHIVLAFVIFTCTWIHCATASVAGGLPQLPWVIAVMLLWVAERAARMLRNVYCNWSPEGPSEADVEALPGETCRVTVHLPRYVDVKPGTHAYLRFFAINPLENHPFSIAWVQHTPRNASLHLPTAEEKRREERASSAATSTTTGATVGRNGHSVRDPVRKSQLRTSVSFVIGAQTGFTRKLYDRARAAGPGAPLRLRALFEGPYAGHHSLDSYGHVLLIAGATGITHQLSYLRHLVSGAEAGTVATRRIVLVWIVRDYEALEWVRPWMDEVLRMPGRSRVLRIRLFVTRPRHAQEIASASRTIQMFPGRPNIPLLVQKEVGEQMGAMCVSVCGPGALADDVRSAVRHVQDEGNVVDFIEEAFTW